MATTRYGMAALISLMVTLILLFLMQLLIVTGKGALVEDRVGQMLDFVRVPRPEEPPMVDHHIPQPPRVVEQPPVPNVPDDIFETGNPVVYIPGPGNVLPPDMDNDFGGFGGTGELMPIVKVAPVYPARALAAGLEGHVMLEYTVTRNGSVADVVVVESSSRVFEKAAVASAMKYKYKPRYINGDPVEVRGVGTIIRFELED